VGDELGRSLKGQGILDQACGARLPEDFWKDFGEALGAEPRPELREQTRLGQRSLRGPVEEEPEGDIDLRLPDHALIGQVVVKLQERELEQTERVNRAAPQIGRVTVG